MAISLRFRQFLCAVSETDYRPAAVVIFWQGTENEVSPFDGIFKQFPIYFERRIKIAGGHQAKIPERQTAHRACTRIRRKSKIETLLIPSLCLRLLC